MAAALAPAPAIDGSIFDASTAATAAAPAPVASIFDEPAEATPTPIVAAAPGICTFCCECSSFVFVDYNSFCYVLADT